MELLSNAERELVAIGAALGSNCVPCTEYHIQEARKAGLSDRRISEAIHLADRIRQIPAQKALAAALGMPSEAAAEFPASQGGAQRATAAEVTKPCCG